MTSQIRPPPYPPLPVVNSQDADTEPGLGMSAENLGLRRENQRLRRERNEARETLSQALTQSAPGLPPPRRRSSIVAVELGKFAVMAPVLLIVGLFFIGLAWFNLIVYSDARGVVLATLGTVLYLLMGAIGIQKWYSYRQARKAEEKELDNDRDTIGGAS